MKKAVQQIMLGTVTKNEKQTAETLRRIRAAGYDGIELNGFMVKPTSFLVRMLTKAAGMPVGKGIVAAENGEHEETDYRLKGVFTKILERSDGSRRRLQKRQKPSAQNTLSSRECTALITRIKPRCRGCAGI